MNNSHAILRLYLSQYESNYHRSSETWSGKCKLEMMYHERYQIPRWTLYYLLKLNYRRCGLLSTRELHCHVFAQFERFKLFVALKNRNDADAPITPILSSICGRNLLHIRFDARRFDAPGHLNLNLHCIYLNRLPRMEFIICKLL